ncbi:DUF6777 domain-containing protein [Streptomyces sp. NPDC050418]|uniref:DUF6777 domain-containing protein n=1 Tax=Streptomyces sp. NPDC050418 TaxID=3365612 RepID=UPI0037A4614C
MHSPTRRYAMALAISGALLVAGCSGSSENDAGDTGDTGSDKELFLQPVAASGPDPFTESTAKVAESPPPVTRTPQPSPTGSASPTQAGIRSVSGSTPGLYGGTQSVSSCDVEQQVRFLTGEQAKARAFAQAAGIQEGEIAGWLRGLTPVQLRADTRVTNHGYQGGRATSYQSVLQAGTAVLVDNRGLPRVRCACGNPLTPPAELRNDAKHQGQPWRGYHPTTVVVVKPSTTVINNITIINVTNNTWIERPIGDDGDKDKVVPPPEPSPTPPTTTSPPPTSPEPSTSEPTPETTDPDEETTDPGEETTDPGEETTDPGEETTDPGTDTTAPDDQITDCPSTWPTPADPNDPPPTLPEGCPLPPGPPPVPDTGDPDLPQDQDQDQTDRTDIPSLPEDQTVPDETGPESVPDVPDVEPGEDSPFIPDATAPEGFSG